MKVSVFGGGAWGRALAFALAEKNDVRIRWVGFTIFCYGDCYKCFERVAYACEAAKRYKNFMCE